MKFTNRLLSIVITSVLLSSCGTSVVYMKDAAKLPQEVLNKANNPSEPHAMPGDLIQIIVSSRNPEAAKPYNKSTDINSISTTSTSSSQDLQCYLVDNNGEIEFPVIGKLQIKGLSKAEIKELVLSKLYPNHLSERPSVEVRFKNFQVTLLGEVKSPGTITVSNERINILEAIASAGDLTINGEREKVRLVRTSADGVRTIHTINLNDPHLTLSPYYNLQQNDVVYVEPNGSKKRSSWSIPPALSLIMSSVGFLVSLATLGLTLFK